ncbi:MAG: ammonium transporter [Gammaproteobacteria bacterium]|nr:ammonium transporter [Gammaproteobacteria bacterium]MDH4253720.1 ammonium transporter [Gammaproteobacteria bacterium]MDH5309649.1 ammonium transporter [Gammaproteobacteria bacterium]
MEELTQLSARIDGVGYALDTFYLLVMGALVMWMAAGFTMLEAGLVRAKNTAEILTKNVGLYAIACIMYMLCGYSIMYPGDFEGAVFRNLTTFGTGLVAAVDNDLAAVSGGDASYSRLADFFFQVVFVATAMSIVSGAVAERMKLWSFFTFAAVLTAVIYPVQGFWKWGGGFLEQLGFADFAGSGVVHLCGASAALAGILVLGPRKGKYGPGGAVNAIPGCNLPLATLGTMVLWLGWFGFNGGSVLRISDVGSANSVALVFVNTNMAAAGGLLGAMLVARAWFGKADLTVILNGALAGLVAITAEPVGPSPFGATCIGLVAGLLVFLSIVMLDKLRIDDPVGAISVHGVAGMYGLLVVPASNADASLGIQLLGLLCIVGWVFVTSIGVWLALRYTVGVRVDEQTEYEGVDLHECGLEAYPEFTTAD